LTASLALDPMKNELSRNIPNKKKMELKGNVLDETA
jgi:hypothetical protein